jgi:hypothetical protein
MNVESQSTSPSGTTRRCDMHNGNLHKKASRGDKADFHKGQRIIYKGEEASVLDVKPVFTIKVKGKNMVVCGNVLLNDVRPLRH